jgi:mannose-6-phosphate isomerase-like protein (cupin superfamily)
MYLIQLNPEVSQPLLADAMVAAQRIVGTAFEIKFSRVRPGFPLHGLHRHPNEQVNVVLEGAYVMQVGEESLTLGKGDVVHIPPSVPHGGLEILEEMLVLEIFAPPKSD